MGGPAGSSSAIVLVVELVVVLALEMSVPIDEFPNSSPSSTTRARTRTIHIENGLPVTRA